MWLLTDNVFERINSSYKVGLFDANAQVEYETRSLSASSSSSSRILSIAGDQAEIKIEGVLTKRPDFMAYLFGGGNTMYGDIIAALAEVEHDDDVKAITLFIDSPGGTVDGMFDALAAIQASSKPIKTIAGGMVASAAYALASATNEITASSRASSIGSIGVAVSMHLDDSTVTLTSTEAPKKRPDVSTEVGKKAVVEQLDAIHDLFVETIAGGRGVTVETVNAEFGRGATLLADHALKMGMIDAVAGPSLKVVKSNPKPTTAETSGEPIEATKMDLEELQAKHPELYKAVHAKGVTEERDRVNGHLIIGQKAGALDIAIGAIKSGDAMTATLTAEYMAAGFDRQDIAARDKDATDVTAATETETETVNEETRDTKLSKELEAQFLTATGYETIA